MCCGKEEFVAEKEAQEEQAAVTPGEPVGAEEAPEGALDRRVRYYARKKEIKAVRFVGDGASWVMGVPARDLTTEEWVGLSDEQRAAAVGSKLYEIDKDGG